MDFMQKIRNVLSRNTSNIHNAINGRRESVLNSTDFNIAIKQLDIVFKEELKMSSDKSIYNSLNEFKIKNILSIDSERLLIDFCKFINSKHK